MKKLLFSWLLFLMVTIVNAQVYLGSGTTQTGISPIDVNYGYSYTQQIFAKSEINASAAGNISSVKFYLPANAVLTNSSNWVVYVGHTSKTSFSSTTDWIPLANLTQVFSGSVSHVSGVTTITFSTPFAYNNTDNLVIAAFENTPDYDASSNRFYNYTGVTNTTLYLRSDSTVPDPSSPAAGTRSATKSVMSIIGLSPATVPACPAVTGPATAATGISSFPTFTWTASPNASSYKIRIGTTPGGSDILNNLDVGNVNTYTLQTSLNLNTVYYYSVSATNAAGDSVNCTERSFTTIASPACPSVSAPGTNMTGLSVRPTFTWATANSASGYRLSIGTTAGNYNILNNFDVGNVLTYSLTAAQQLNPNTEYFYIVTSYNGTVVSTGCTERKFTTGIVPPANDECSGAISLTVNPALLCTNSTPGNTLGATTSMGATPCSGTPNDDVWFNFVATNTSHIVSLKDIVSTGVTTGTTDMYFQVLSGSCTGTMTSLLCSDDNSNTVAGLTPGQTYYVRVYTYSSTGNANASFNICILTPPPAPTNDECATAIPLTVNPDLNCGVVTSGTTLGGTNSSVPVGSCTGTPDDDVWYSFVATGTTNTVWLKNVVSVGTSSSTSLYAQVFSGSCGNTTSIACITSNTTFTILNGLTAGQTYYVRVYNSESNSGASLYASSFDLCIGTMPPPPANDNCSGAVNLTVNQDYNCGSFATGTTISATASSETAPTCGASGTNDDVWYKFTATNTAHRVTLSNVSGSTDMAMAVYSGVCGSLVQVTCSDPNTMNLTGLTVGTEYTVRVWTYSATASTMATFDICVGTAPPAPANDNCSTATALTVSATDQCTSPVSGTTASATASTETAPTCAASGINDDVWYSFVATAATHLVTVNYSDNATATQVYSGACGSLVAVACSDGGVGNSNVLLNTLTVGQTYYVRVYSSSSTAATSSNFTICINTPTAPVNDDCATAIPIACNGTVTGNTALATDDTLPASTCGSSSSYNYKGVWHTVTATATGPITIDACGTEFDSYIRVYSGSCGTLTCVDNTSGVGYADAGCTSNNFNASKVTFNGVAGTTYYVLLTGYTAARFGKYSITVTQNCTGLGTSDIITKNENLKVYPNPFADVLNISDVKNVKSIYVMDASGKLVKSFDKPESTLRLADLNAGMYLVVLTMKDGSKQTIKAIKK